jgi:RNA-directed DNA polymerase
VTRMQQQIAQASQRGDIQAVHNLQQRLMESEAARMMAVRRVTEENSGKNTAGVDGVKSLTAKERLEMANMIHPRYWNNQPVRPVRRVWIPKPGTAERRPLAILTMLDRCKQALVKLALEAEWETRFEPHSYGYRPGRSARDAIAAILTMIERQPCFVFDADIEGAFDNVSQEVLLDKLQTFPTLRRAINAWLSAGVIDGNTFSVSAKGIAQGGVLSPLLMNVALHGMETVVGDARATASRTNTVRTTANNQDQPSNRSATAKVARTIYGDRFMASQQFQRNMWVDHEGLSSQQSRGQQDSWGQAVVVRYADDFVIVHSDLNELKRAIKRVRQWLAAMGLRFHAQKTHITHTMTPYQGRVGFDFLGFHIRQERSSRVRTIVTPSQEANVRHVAAIEQRLKSLQAVPQAKVIAELNPLILGWGNYYAGIVDGAIMRKYDELMEQLLLQWASKRHPGKGRDWLIVHYWHRAGHDGRVFASEDGMVLRGYEQRGI